MFQLIMLGMVLMFASFGLGACVMMNLLPGQIYTYIEIGMGICFGLYMAVIGILGNGVIGPVISAKFGQRNLIAIITGSKNIRLEPGRERNGMTTIKGVGKFITPTDTMYTWANGVKGGIAYFKYATTLSPTLIEGSTVLKEKYNVKDIGEYEAKAIAEAEKGNDFTIDLG